MAKRKNNEGCFSDTIRTVKGKSYKYKKLTITTGYDGATGKQLQKVFYGKTEKECNEKKEKFFNNKGNTVGGGDTFGGYFLHFLDNKRDAFKPSTFERYMGIYNNYILTAPKISNTKLNELTKEQFVNYFKKLKKEGKQPKSLNNINRYFKACLEEAAKDDIIKKNPVSNIKFNEKVSIVEEEESINFIEVEQQKDLIKALQGDELESIILLGLMCGMRLGEILALGEGDIDFKANWINISKSIRRISEFDEEGNKIIDSIGNKTRFKIDTPKTKGSKRKIPLPIALVDKLKGSIKANKLNKLKYGDLYYNKGLLFCNDDGTPLDNKKPNRRLKMILKKANIKEDLHFHSLRHIFISNCVNKDINPRTVMEWVGHSNINTTMNIYAKVSDAKLKESSNLINDIFSSII
ncbi:site-specific integrase [Clostridium gasigenes]|uniref:tyrosine-type recombinase/integrase n=1 Tax=Clostridium gasigenes TaxID=94869 RepID=UPI0016240A4D|nr:site-specific integrase [Clostridium gasigenes]MBB6622182.1 site-specific integrase [Clostridium gasigenes]